MVYAASVAGLTPDERATFDDALAPRRRVIAPPIPVGRPVLRAVPDPERISEERLAAIAALGGEVTFGEGA